jgi:hypothetical protein
MIIHRDLPPAPRQASTSAKGIGRVLPFAVGLAALWLAGSTAAAAPLSSNSVQFVADVAVGVRGTLCRHGQVASVGPQAAGALLDILPANLAGRIGIDALIITSNRVFFSTDADFRIGGVLYADEDLVALNPTGGTYSLYFDGSAKGLPPGTDLDAACFEYGTTNLLLSLDITASLPGGLTVTDDDVIRYAGSVFAKLYDGQTNLSIPEPADIDGLYQDQSHLYFSLNLTTTIQSLTGADEDIWRYQIATKAISLIQGIGIDPKADLTGIGEATDADGDWLTDFEELTGIDDPATTYPGTAAPVDPGGFKSNPNLADTDGDGVGDGGEAACGTDPTDRRDVLRLLAIRPLGGEGVELEWNSAPGRHYAVYGGESAEQPLTNAIVNHVPAAGGTNRTAYVHANANPSNLYYRIRLDP